MLSSDGHDHMEINSDERLKTIQKRIIKFEKEVFFMFVPCMLSFCFTYTCALLHFNEKTHSLPTDFPVGLFLEP